MSVGLGDATALAVGPGRDGRQFLRAAGEDIAVALLQGVVLAWGEPFALALGDTVAGLPQEPPHVPRPGVTVGLIDEGQFAQEMRPTQAMAAVVIRQIRRPAVVDEDPAIARDDADGGHGLQTALLMDELTRGVAARADVNPVVSLIDP
nr:hypothetical protein [Acidiferrobacter sp. SPIII_3]